jgi:diketogulonate reductase-like aldo/keto reductase
MSSSSKFEYLTLNNNTKIPPFGFGTYKLENIPEKIKFALNNGYRLIDTAKIYKNEEEVGKGINEYLSSQKEIKREDLYIVTKLWQDDHKDPVNALKESLKRLNLSYVDLYLIHWPLPNFDENTKKLEKKIPLHIVWEGMEKCVELGLTKSIGVSNFNAQLLLDLCSYAKILPVINQVEIHPLLQQKKLVKDCNYLNIKLMAYMPLVRMGEKIEGEKFDLYTNEKILNLAKKYKQNPTCIVLNWHLHRKIIPIPKANGDEHIKDNILSLQFVMEEDEYKIIDEFDQNLRLCLSDYRAEGFDIFA